MLIFKKAQTKFIRLYNQNHCVVFYLNTQSIETHCSEEVLNQVENGLPMQILIQIQRYKDANFQKNCIVNMSMLFLHKF